MFAEYCATEIFQASPDATPASLFSEKKFSWYAERVHHIRDRLDAELRELRRQNAAFRSQVSLRFDELRAARSQLEDWERSIHDLNEGEMYAASTRAQASARRSVVGFALGLGVSILLSLAAVWWLQRTILGPIRTVTEAADARRESATCRPGFSALLWSSPNLPRTAQRSPLPHAAARGSPKRAPIDMPR